jgi:hypothetical protein
MRNLTKKQKNLLDQLAAKGITCVDEMPFEEWEKLEKMNDTEVLWQNANRYLLDKSFEASRQNGW